MVNRTVIFTMESIFLYNNCVALFTFVDTSKKVIKANKGNDRMVLNKIPEAIQNAGNLERDCASVFWNNSIK